MCAALSLFRLLLFTLLYVVLGILHVMFRFRGLVSRFGVYDVSWFLSSGQLRSLFVGLAGSWLYAVLVTQSVRGVGLCRGFTQ